MAPNKSNHRPQWTVEELACALNWIDYCLKTGEPFKTTVSDMVKQIHNRERPYKGVKDRLRKFLKIECKVNKAVEDFIQQGTQSIPLGCFFDNLRRAMNKQRKNLNLDGLERSDKGSSTRQKEQYSSFMTSAEVQTTSTRQLSPRVLIKSTHSNATHSHQDVQPPTVSPITPLVEMATGSVSSLAGRRLHIPEVQAPTHPETIEGLRSDMLTLFDVLGWLMTKLLEVTPNHSNEIRKRVVILGKTLQNEGRGAFQKYYQDLLSADQAKSQYRDQLMRLVKNHDFAKTLEFPRAPSDITLDDEWKAIWKEFGRVVVEYGSAQLFAPTKNDGYICGYVTARNNDLLDPEKVPDSMLDEYFWSFGIPLKSPHIIQNVLSSLLCRWLFASPDPMCSPEHWRVAMEIYGHVHATMGIKAVRQMDQLATSLFFTSPYFESEIRKNRIQSLCDSLSNCLNAHFRTCPGLGTLKDHRKWLEKAIKLKEAVLISPDDYRVHFFEPGDEFDSSWMKPVDADGIPIQDVACRSKCVRLCLAPALLKQPTDNPAPDADLKSVLVTNKVFLPSYSEKMAFKSVNTISKAIVLVE